MDGIKLDEKQTTVRPTYAMIAGLAGDVKENRRHITVATLLAVALSGVTLGVVIAGNEIAKESHVNDSGAMMSKADANVPVATAKFQETGDLMQLLNMDVDEIGEINNIILEEDGVTDYFTVTGFTKSTEKLDIHTARGVTIEIEATDDSTRHLLTTGGVSRHLLQSGCCYPIGDPGGWSTTEINACALQNNDPGKCVADGVCLYDATGAACSPPAPTPPTPSSPGCCVPPGEPAAWTPALEASCDAWTSLGQTRCQDSGCSWTTNANLCSACSDPNQTPCCEPFNGQATPAECDSIFSLGQSGCDANPKCQWNECCDPASSGGEPSGGEGGTIKPIKGRVSRAPRGRP